MKIFKKKDASMTPKPKKIKKKKKGSFKEISNRSGYKFFLPWMIGFLIFTAFPFIYTI